MPRPGWIAVFIFALLLVAAGPTQAQIATYSLHKENSTVVSTNMQLKTAAADASTLTLQTANLKNVAPGEYVIKSFETQANVPNIAGVIPAGSSFLLRLYMDKTADSGSISSLAKIYKNSTSGTSICNATGFGLTTTRSLHTFLCTPSSDVTFTATDRFFVWVGVSVSTAPTVNNTKG